MRSSTHPATRDPPGTISGMMFRLAHLSDVHLGPLPRLPWRRLLSKRATGYVNWHRARGRSMGPDTLDALVADMLAHEPDHIAVSGDLTNLALPEEIANAARWLESLGPPETVSVVPGNHDAYLRGTALAAMRAWEPHATGERIGDALFPYLRRLGPVALIGCSSAEATPPFVAAGPFRAGQGARLAQLLGRAGEEGLFRVAMVHHPPVRGAAPNRKRMLGIGHFQDALGRGGAELVLHGHTHLPTQHSIEVQGGPLAVIGVAAAGQAPGGRHPAARYNLFEIEGAPGAWTCTQIERGVGADGGVREVARRQLSVPGGR